MEPRSQSRRLLNSTRKSDLVILQASSRSPNWPRLTQTLLLSSDKDATLTTVLGTAGIQEPPAAKESHSLSKGKGMDQVSEGKVVDLSQLWEMGRDQRTYSRMW